MQRLVLIAGLAGLIACSSGTPPALAPDGSSPINSSKDTGVQDVEPDASDANPCSPYVGGRGFILESRLPSGACTAPGTCRINTAGECPGNPRSPSPVKNWQCTCEGGSWSCAFLAVGKLDCGGADAGTPETQATSPDAAYCCPRDTVMQGCMRLGGVNQFGCFETCDFWCSTNWRVEVDQFGCERWEHDYRTPTPGENAECLPAQDAGASPGG